MQRRNGGCTVRLSDADAPCSSHERLQARKPKATNTLNFHLQVFKWEEGRVEGRCVQGACVCLPWRGG